LYATVTVTPISADYANQKVTFKVAWNSAPYNNRVWIWIDFCPISDITPGSFSPATITGATITSGSGSISGLTGRGFFITGSTTNSGTTITATLNPVPAGKFNWCAYGSDYPPNATINNGTYTLKGTSPFVVNGTTTLGAGVKTYSGGCITSLTDATGCPGIINYTNLTAGTINSSSTFVRTGVTPAAITSNTNASSGGGFTYRWVRTGTSNATYTGNTAGHSFVAAEVSSAGTWTYYREVRDNTCNTSTWSRSSGSYKLTVVSCSYTGSDLYIDATHLCQLRTSGAKNWQAYIKDSRDSEIYRIVLMPDNKWWLAQNVKYANTGAAISGCNKDVCGRVYTTSEGRSAQGGTSGTGANKQGVCPNNWVLPVINNWTTFTNAVGAYNAARIRAHNGSNATSDYYGWSGSYPGYNGGIASVGEQYIGNDYDANIGCFLFIDCIGCSIEKGNAAYIGRVSVGASLCSGNYNNYRQFIRCFRQL
jgi:uncharacterized protein (TIGR02145 family)